MTAEPQRRASATAYRSCLRKANLTMPARLGQALTGARAVPLAAQYA